MAERDLEKIAAKPEDFALILSGHNDHAACNGKYLFAGEKNGKPKWEKEGDSSINVHWTGRSWDCFWGGYSPEACTDTPVPPLTGYDRDKGGTEIVVEYESLVGGTADKSSDEGVLVEAPSSDKRPFTI